MTSFSYHVNLLSRESFATLTRSSIQRLFRELHLSVRAPLAARENIEFIFDPARRLRTTV
jgi:hypothetical protein